MTNLTPKLDEPHVTGARGEFVELFTVLSNAPYLALVKNEDKEQAVFI